MITSSQAANIALNYAGDGWSVANIDFLYAANPPNYMIELINEGELEKYKEGITPAVGPYLDVRVNANTGEIME